MVETADAIVIGGGIMGASTAYYLTKLGFGKVLVLERLFLASGSTGHSAANVSTTPAKWPSDWPNAPCNFSLSLTKSLVTRVVSSRWVT